MHLHGDRDKLVPLELNSAIVAERYQQLDAEMHLELIVGPGHNLWPGWFQTQQLVDFIIENASKP